MALLAPRAGHARVIGLTGSPGVGKSTSTSALVAAYRRRGMQVGVLAVDPSSPFSGGALLGDRVRMQDHATDDGVFIRSMASRGHLGGLSWATPQALRVLSAAGCDVVLVETVGVGQAEVEVASLADTTLVLLAPGMGDGIQAAKAGILEVADLFVVNKADRDGADTVVRDLRYMLSLGDRRTDEGWRVPILKTVAARGRGRRRGRRGDREARGVARRQRPARSSAAGSGPPTRSRRSRSPRCGPGSATCAAASRSAGWRRASWRGSWTRTPPPTSW